MLVLLVNMLDQICGIKLVRKNVVFIALLALLVSVLISFYYQNIVLEKVQFFRYNLYTRSFVIGNKAFTETQCDCSVINTTLATPAKLPICNQTALSSKAGRSCSFEYITQTCLCNRQRFSKAVKMIMF